MKPAYALLALAALMIPDLAAAGLRQQQVAVEIGDLDLATARGQKMLALRVHRAARALCAAEAVETLPQTIRARRECTRQAQAAAMAVAEAAIRARAEG